MGTFVIAEAGSSHDNDLLKAKRLIEAAKECGADAVKFQWTSRPYDMAKRRGLDQQAGNMYDKYLCKPEAWLYDLKEHCDKVGIEFMCTVYLIEDIATIAPLVKRFKVSAFEATWGEFLFAHKQYGKWVIISQNVPAPITDWQFKRLYCVSKYPTALEDLHLSTMRGGVQLEPDGPEWPWSDGLSDHTANVLTGAAAVAAGARIVEAHIRLHDTDKGNPDYGHSLIADVYELAETGVMVGLPAFSEYVRNIRTVERML